MRAARSASEGWPGAAKALRERLGMDMRCLVMPQMDSSTDSLFRLHRKRRLTMPQVIMSRLEEVIGTNGNLIISMTWPHSAAARRRQCGPAADAVDLDF